MKPPPDFIPLFKERHYQHMPSGQRHRVISYIGGTVVTVQDNISDLRHDTHSWIGPREQFHKEFRIMS